MTVTVVLRLVRECLDAGRLVGHAELVDTGERATVLTSDDLVAFARGAAGDAATEPREEIA